MRFSLTNKFVFFLILIACNKNIHYNILVEKALAFSFSPDSKRLVYEVHIPSSNNPNNDYTEVYIKNIAGGQESLLFIGKDTCSWGVLDWSPKGDFIALESDIDTSVFGSDILIFPLNRNLRPIRVTHDFFMDSDPSFSPDGNKIAFVSDRCGRKYPVICVKPINNGQIQILTEKVPLACSKPAWHPNGRKIIFTGVSNTTAWDIYSIDLITGEITPIVNSPAQEYWASFSPDGKYLLFLRYDKKKLSIWIKDLSTNKEYLFADVKPVYYSGPEWSPDGKKIVFSIPGNENDPNYKIVCLPFDPEKLKNASR
jgi:Tol biopolymer transport system component